MSIDITIKQKGFFKKTLPLSVILGNDLKYGAFVNDALIKDTIGENEIVIYHPEHIGRGFSIIWNENEKKQVHLRLPQPSTPKELADFYQTVKRICLHWQAALTVDGRRMTLPAFLKGLADTVAFNEKILRRFAEDIISGTHETLTLYSTMWPLHLGKEEASRFLDDPKGYYDWLHEKQTVNARYTSAYFYQGENGIFARLPFFKNTVHLFPKKPSVPFGLTDPNTGKPLTCNDYKILLLHNEESEPEGEIVFDEFINRIPKHKIREYDPELLLIDAFDDEEWQELQKS